MSIQRQADQYNLDVPPPTPRVAQHEIEELIKPGRRIRPGTLDMREAGAHTLDEGTYFNSDFFPPRQRSTPALTRAMPFEGEDEDAPPVVRKQPGRPGPPRHRR
jgi:hypothetical protein